MGKKVKLVVNDSEDSSTAITATLNDVDKNNDNIDSANANKRNNSSNKKGIKSMNQLKKPNYKETNIKKKEMDDDDDDDDDDDFIYSDEDDDDDDDELIGTEEEDVLPEEIEFLQTDQLIPIKYNQSTTPKLFYPSIKNNAIKFYEEHKKAAHIMIVIFISFITFFIILYSKRSTIMTNGYCNNINESSSSSSLKNQFIHSCIPCPKHGVCNNGELTCEPLYRKHRSFTNHVFNHLWPFSENCIKDTTKTAYVRRVEYSIHRYLKIQQGKKQCFEAWDFLSSTSCQTYKYTLPMAKTNIKYVISYLNQIYHLKDVDQNEIIDLAIKNVIDHPNIFVTKTDNELFLSTDRAKFNDSCNLWTTYCNIPQIIRFILFIIPLFYILHNVLYKKYNTYQTKKRNIIRMENSITIYLQNQKERFLQNNDNERGYTLNILRSEMNINSENIDIWKQAISNIKKYSSVRKSSRISHGEPVEYLEWV
ncbi:unnamed protein product [Cunninghamella blakesleeana]